MWLVTDRGFYSTRVHRDDDNKIEVRARVRADLEALAPLIPSTLTISDTPTFDYPYRTSVDRLEWREAVATLVDEMDYVSFTASIARKQGVKRQRITKQAWGELLALEDLERPDPYKQTA